MKQAVVSLPSKDFSRIVAIASKAVERRTTIPILSMLRCRANGALEVSGTDLDMTITARVEHGGGPKVDFILPEASKLAQGIALGGGETVDLEYSDGKIDITSGALSISVENSLCGDDFPDSSTSMASESFTATMSHAQLRSLGRVAAAVSTEETRYYLNGVCLHHVEGSTYRAAATDGHRLCMIDVELPDATGEIPRIIIPRKALRILLSLAGRHSPDDAGARVTVGGHNLPNRENSTAPERGGAATRIRTEIVVGDVAVSLDSKLIDGTFPDYARVVPKECSKSFVFDAAEFRRAIAAASCGAKKTPAIRLTFDPKGALVEGPYYGDTKTIVRVACDHRHTGFTVGFNGTYLLSMLDAAGPGQFVLSTNDASPATLVNNPADPSWRGVLMPMRV